MAGVENSSREEDNSSDGIQTRCNGNGRESFREHVLLQTTEDRPGSSIGEETIMGSNRDGGGLRRAHLPHHTVQRHLQGQVSSGTKTQESQGRRRRRKTMTWNEYWQEARRVIHMDRMSREMYEKRLSAGQRTKLRLLSKICSQEEHYEDRREEKEQKTLTHYFKTFAEHIDYINK